ncbi:PucR family transcriptional regulator [Actinoallomurus rhizosphaericola]|uniref:PucR family transcriptional regulator n=1 Tax=Actinoallomurus rhizosphaericola TaxID=2952536 RepID=UPI0020926B01|nr:PucR family transcriptional regulator [Actinoallomurus rhizosphaericola]MCO5994827.1 helix-turn-helix domain-containing protein [Actinoallomurus rhizosphaericola]
MTNEGRPWSYIPPELAAKVAPGLADEMMEEIHHRIPEYARRWDDAFATVIRSAIDRVIDEVLRRLAATEDAAHLAGSGDATRPAGPTDPAAEPIADFFRAIGRSVAREGRGLDGLQTAIRVAGLAVWRRISADAGPLRLSAQVLCVLGETVMLIQDEVAAAAAEGYAQAEAAVAGELTRRRNQLVNLLLARPPASPEDVAELARVARWPVPRTVAAVALYERRQGVGRPALPPDILADLSRSKPCLIVPDPDGPGRARLLDAALTDWVAVVGPTVGLSEVARSMRWARQGLDLVRRGLIAGTDVVRCAEHMSTLILFQDEELLAALSARQLAPLAHLRPSQQDRLAETLLAWLQAGRNANEVAVRLHVHPQTVRYRLRQLDDLFGDQLQDPDLRFELEIVLRARALLSEDTRAREHAEGQVISLRR